MWDPRKKPPADVCPRKYCFFWNEQGSCVAPGLYNSKTEALRHLVRVAESHCGCPFGRCTRLDPLHGNQDWYDGESPQGHPPERRVLSCPQY